MMRIIYRLGCLLTALSLLASCSTYQFSASSSNNVQTSQPLPAQLPKHIAVMLPLRGPMGSAGNVIRDGFLASYYAGTTPATQPALSFYDTASGQSVTALYQKAVADGADFVIGPLTKPEVNALLSLDDFPAPVLALNYTNRSIPKNVYLFGLSPENEAVELAQHAHDAGLSNALIIAPQNAWGQRVANALTKQWTSLGGHVVETLSYTRRATLTDDIAQLLQIKKPSPEDKNQPPLPPEQRRRQDFDVVFVLATPVDARQIVPILKFDYVSHIPIYATSAIYSGIPDPKSDADLDGVYFCDVPWILQMSSRQPQKSNYNQFNRLYAVGRDAWLIMTQLNGFTVNPNFSLSAATGILSLPDGQHFNRHPAWAEFSHGHATQTR
ncbi:MAG: penicillin-binding protein activator [Gammaproteobacteria bacterium]|nr:penicillin-binding protein activator [Gammaproteobacteria bacterium]